MASLKDFPNDTPPGAVGNPVLPTKDSVKVDGSIEYKFILSPSIAYKLPSTGFSDISANLCPVNEEFDETSK